MIRKFLSSVAVKNILDWLNLRKHVVQWQIYRRNSKMTRLMGEARGLGIPQSRINDIAANIKVPRRYWTNLFIKALEKEIKEKE